MVKMYTNIGNIHPLEEKVLILIIQEEEDHSQLKKLSWLKIRMLIWQSKALEQNLLIMVSKNSRDTKKLNLIIMTFKKPFKIIEGPQANQLLRLPRKDHKIWLTMRDSSPSLKMLIKSSRMECLLRNKTDLVLTIQELAVTTITTNIWIQMMSNLPGINHRIIICKLRKMMLLMSTGKLSKT
jgi:hypothetical protein